jgi:hypothetical protein
VTEGSRRRMRPPLPGDGHSRSHGLTLVTLPSGLRNSSWFPGFSRSPSSEPRESSSPGVFFWTDLWIGDGTLESLQSSAGKEKRTTIFATLGCCRVRWISRTRMGNAGARESDAHHKGWATLGASIPICLLTNAG